jgi:hypothetical protein
MPVERNCGMQNAYCVCVCVCVCVFRCVFLQVQPVARSNHRCRENTRRRRSVAAASCERCACVFCLCVCGIIVCMLCVIPFFTDKTARCQRVPVERSVAAAPTCERERERVCTLHPFNSGSGCRCARGTVEHQRCSLCCVGACQTETTRQPSALRVCVGRVREVKQGLQDETG